MSFSKHAPCSPSFKQFNGQCLKTWYIAPLSGYLLYYFSQSYFKYYYSNCIGLIDAAFLRACWSNFEEKNFTRFAVETGHVAEGEGSWKTTSITSSRI
jgi:hypothetical protein